MSDKRTGIQRALAYYGGGSRGLVAVAYHLGVSAQVVWKWKRIGGVPLTKFCDQLSKLTGVPMSDLVPHVTDKGDGGQPTPRRVKRGKRGTNALTSCSTPLRAVRRSERAHCAANG
jgi:hypothetical protein